MNMETVNSVFVEELELLNEEAGISENNDWLSPVFIDEYEERLEQRIRRSRQWRMAQSAVQIVMLVIVFYPGLLNSLFAGVERRYLILGILVSMVLFNVFASRQQKHMANFEQQLLLIGTYKKIAERAQGNGL